MLVGSFFSPLCSHIRITSTQNLNKILHRCTQNQVKEKRKKPNRNESIFVMSTHETNSNEPCLPLRKNHCYLALRRIVSTQQRCERKRERFLKRNVNTALWHPKQYRLYSIVKYKRCEYDLLFDFASLYATNFRSCVYDKFYDIYIIIASNDGNPMVNIHMAYTKLIALRK